MVHLFEWDDWLLFKMKYILVGALAGLINEFVPEGKSGIREIDISQSNDKHSESMLNNWSWASLQTKI